MVRDFELIRKILLEVQAMPASSGPIAINFEGEFEQAEVDEHVDLLIEAGLLNGKVIRGMSGVQAMSIRGLTWDGHDFIEAAEKDVLWKKALETIREKGGAITFEVLKAMLKSLALKAAGLP